MTETAPLANGDTIRVVIADDHEVFRRGLQSVLDAEPDIEVIGEAEEGDDAVGLADAARPDVVLMDVRLRGLDGIEATRRIHEAHPEMRVLMLSVSDAEDDLFAAIRAGASGYLLKGASTEEVAVAIRAAVRGYGPVSPPLAARLFDEFRSLSEQVGDGQRASRLTPREVEVLAQIASGRSNKEIAGELVIAENTVKNHVRNILEKLQLHSRVEAAMYAVREGLVTPD